MKTREESLNNFNSSLDEMINTNYLFVSQKIFDLMSQVNQSKLLSDMFKYFSEDYNLYGEMSNYLGEEEGIKYFNIPTDKKALIPLAYNLMMQINYNNIQLSDILDYMGVEKNYDMAYSLFAERFLIPFKQCVNIVCDEIISNTKWMFDENNSQEEILPNEQPKQEVEQVEVNVADEKKINKVCNLIELDKLSVAQSKLKKDEKEELIYILDIFYQVVSGCDFEKIKLAYFAYYYALKPYKKIKSNVQSITRILMEEGVLA